MPALTQMGKPTPHLKNSQVHYRYYSSLTHTMTNAVDIGKRNAQSDSNEVWTSLCSFASPPPPPPPSPSSSFAASCRHQNHHPSLHLKNSQMHYRVYSSLTLPGDLSPFHPPGHLGQLLYYRVYSLITRFVELFEESRGAIETTIGKRYAQSDSNQVWPLLCSLPPPPPPPLQPSLPSSFVASSLSTYFVVKIIIHHHT